MARIKYTLEQHIKAFWAKVDQSGGGDACWLWLATRDKDGYGVFWWNNTNARSHRVMWELTYGAIPEGLWVLHQCDNPPCCNPNHLFIGTNQDNVDDKVRKGRLPTGERHGSRTHPEHLPRGECQHKHKFTEDEVRAIRSRYAQGGVTLQQLADEHDVTRQAIWLIVKRKNWKHVA